MFEYTIDTKQRQFHTIWQIIITIILTFLVYQIFKSNGIFDIENELFKIALTAFNPLTFFGIFAVLKLVHEKFLWKFMPARPPIYDGKWVGYITHRSEGTGEHEKVETLKPIELKFVQNFSKMAIAFKSRDVSDITKSNPTFANVIGITQVEAGLPKLTFAWSGNGLSGKSEFQYSNDHNIEILEGNYVSDYPRKGFVSVKRLKPDDVYICGKARELTSRSGRTYLAVQVDSQVIEKHLLELKQLEPIRYDELTRKQAHRDNSNYHITLINPDEYNPDLHSDLIGQSLWFEIGNIGKGIKDNHTTFYVTCKCEAFQKIRTEELSLGFCDFHITIGFIPDDIHGIAKKQHISIPKNLRESTPSLEKE